MNNTPSENFLQVDAVNIAPNSRRTVLTQLNKEGIETAMKALKAKIDPTRHTEVDIELDKVMARFAGRVYSDEFSKMINPLNAALRNAVAGKTSDLADLLGLTHITREGAQAQALNQNQISQNKVLDATAAQVSAEQAKAEAAKKLAAERAAAEAERQKAQANSTATGRLTALADMLRNGRTGSQAPKIDVAQK